MLVLKMAILVGALMVPPVESDRPSLRQRLRTAEDKEELAKMKKDSEANQKRMKSDDIIEFMKKEWLFFDVFRYARCCQLEHEWDPVFGIKHASGNTWPWKVTALKIPFDIYVWMKRITQTHVSWKHLNDIFENFWSILITPATFHSRVIKFIACNWKRIDEQTHSNNSLYNSYHLMSRVKLFYRKGYAAELKIMEHAVFCYQMHGYKVNEVFSWSETTWNHIRDAIHCFKREVMAAGDQTIMIEFYNDFVDDLKPKLILSEVVWEISFWTLLPVMPFCAVSIECWDYMLFNFITCPNLVPYRPQTIPGWFTNVKDGKAVLKVDPTFNATYGAILYSATEKWDDVKRDILLGIRRIVKKKGYSVVEYVL